MTPYGGTRMAQIARERDEALRENESLREELAEAVSNPCAQCQAEAERLRKTLVAARDKFAELELPIYAEACDATLLASPK